MNTAKLDVYEKILCQNFVGAEEFIRDKFKEICYNEKLLVEEVTYFVYERLGQLFNLN